MNDVMIVNTPLDHHTQLLKIQYFKSKDVNKNMESSSYTFEVGSIMYEIVFGRINFTYVVNIESPFMKNLVHVN